MPIEQHQIMIIDDEAVVRRALGDALAKAGHRTRTAGSAKEALNALTETPADLVLIDLQLGADDGVEVMRAVRQRWPETQIIILTAHGSMSSAIAAVRHDAADYLLKPVGMDELRARVGEVLARYKAGRERQDRIRSMYRELQALVGDEHSQPSQALESQASPSGAYSAGPLALDVQRHMVRMEGQPVDVTPTEFTILQSLVRSPGVVVSCVQIVQSFQLGINDEDEARQILRPHIVRLRRKLEPDPSRPIYIQSVRGVGYRWSANGESSGEE